MTPDRVDRDGMLSFAWGTSDRPGVLMASKAPAAAAEASQDTPGRRRGLPVLFRHHGRLAGVSSP